MNYDACQLAVLMDIRAQLRELNRTLGCYRVQKMADAMIRLERRAAKRWPMKPRKPRP